MIVPNIPRLPGMPFALAKPYPTSCKQIATHQNAIASWRRCEQIKKTKKETSRSPQTSNTALTLSLRITERIPHNRPWRKTPATQSVRISSTRDNLRRSTAQPLRSRRPHARSVRVHVTGDARDTAHCARAADVWSWHGGLSRRERRCCECCVSS